MTKLLSKLFVFVLLVGLIALSGCSSDINQTTSTENLPKNPIDGGSLRVGITQDIDSLDPHLARSAGTREVLFNVFEGLVKPNADGELKPAIASSYEISDDAMVYTFVLREGVYFHDGSPVSVEDVKYSLDRNADTSGGGPLVSVFSLVEAINIINETTIEVRLVEPNTEFLSFLTVAIIPEGSANTINDNPIGTGPFLFVSRAIGENVILNRFDNYWGTPAFLDEVVFRIITDPDLFVTNLVGGSIDMALRLTAMQAEVLPNDFTVYEGTMNLVQALYLNNGVAPFNNVLLRKALNYAIDPNLIMTMVGDGRGVRVGTSMLPGFKEFFDPSFNTFFEPDLERAMELLAEAGYPDGFSFTLTVTGADLPHVDAAQVIAEQLRAINVNVQIQLVEWSVWLEQVYTFRDYEATIVGVDASYLSPRALLERFTTDEPGNFINFSDAEYDAVFEEAIQETNRDRQKQLYHRLQEILVEQAANVYIQDLSSLIALRNNFAGYVFYPVFAQDFSLIYQVSAD